MPIESLDLDAISMEMGPMYLFLSIAKVAIYLESEKKLAKMSQAMTTTS